MARMPSLAPAIISMTFAGGTTPVIAQSPPARDEDRTPPSSVRNLKLRVLVDRDPVERLEALLDPEWVDRSLHPTS